MAIGDVEKSFQTAALQDGVVLTRHKVPWINQQGHFGLPPQAGSAATALHAIFLALKGDAAVQAGKRTTALPGDFVHVESGTVIEVDEFQHFTSHRRMTFDFYPADFPINYDLDEYQGLCQRLAPRADSYRATKDAIGFGSGGRQRQRAYYDALRDLALPSMAQPPIVRVPVVDGDGSGAYLRHRDRIVSAINR